MEDLNRFLKIMKHMSLASCLLGHYLREFIHSGFQKLKRLSFWPPSVGHASEAVCISFELKAAAFAKCNKVQ
jgi:hypothetical protein